MKRLFITLSLIAGFTTMPTHTLSRAKVAALIQTIIGGGTVGLTASLFQDTSSSIMVEGAKHLYAQAGGGDYISQIRMHLQQAISEMHSDGVQRTLDIEKVIYVAVGLIGAVLVLDGIASLLSDEKDEKTA
jgi:hypothetical protein